MLPFDTVRGLSERATALCANLAASNVEAWIFGSVGVWMQCPMVRERLEWRPGYNADIDLICRADSEAPLLKVFERLHCQRRQAEPYTGGIYYEFAMPGHAGTGEVLVHVYLGETRWAVLVPTVLTRGSVVLDPVDIMLTKLAIAQPSPTDFLDCAALFLEHQHKPMSHWERLADACSPRAPRALRGNVCRNLTGLREFLREHAETYPAFAGLPEAIAPLNRSCVQPAPGWWYRLFRSRAKEGNKAA